MRKFGILRYRNTKQRAVIKTIRVMKLTTILLLAAVFSVAAKGTAQNAVSISVKNTSLKHVLRELKNKTDYTFVYSERTIKNVKVKEFSADNIPFKLVLAKVLEPTNLTYRIEEKVVVIREKALKSKSEKVQQQKKYEIKGKVTDEDGVPLPGVSVVIKGTTTGISTDVNGNYTLKFTQRKANIVFSFVGMIPQTIEYTGQATINVVLKSDATQMDEVVVTGYQEMKRERVTGSVTVINAKDIADKSYASVDQLLAGKVSGLASFMSSGQAGKSANISIRGVNTLSGSTQPLWIVDGLPMQGEVPDVSGGGSALEANILNNGIGNIPASDISSITVLKDAAAAAIYGARAANGVIIINTKKGHDGKVYCNANASFSFSKAPSFDLDFMNTAEKITYETELFEDFKNVYNFRRDRGGRVFKILTDVKRGKLSRAEGDKLINDLSKINTNWSDEIFRNSLSKTYGANLSGGNKKITYYFSVNRQEQEGVLKNDSYDNTSIRAKGTFKPNDKFDIVVGINTSVRNKKYHNSTVNPLKYAIYANPYERAYDDEGNDAYDETYLSDSYKKGLTSFTYDKFNIINEIENTGYNSKYTSTSAFANLRYYILKDLKFTSKFVTTRTQKDINDFAKPGTYASYSKSWLRSMITRDLKEDENLGYYKETAVFADEYSLNNTLEFSRELKNKFYVSVFLGQEISAIETKDMFTYMPEYYPDYDIVGYPNINDIEGKDINMKRFGGKGYKERRYSSFFSSVTVSYDDRYVANFNARYDGADIIGDAERFTPLWSASARWNLHKEKFFNVSFINELAVKGEYGYTGNINRDAYPFTTITLSGTSRYKGDLVASRYTYPNPSIKWEKKEERSFGVDASLFNYRLNLHANYYYNTVSDVLSYRRLPKSAGVTSLVANVSNLLNTGIELGFNFVPIRVKDFQLSLNFNGTYNKNEASKTFYSGLEALKPRTLLTSQPTVSGYAVNSVFGFVNKGIDPKSGNQMVEVNRAQVEPYTTPTGHIDYAVETIDRDQVNLDYDRAICLGQLNPKYTGGFGVSANYKNWEFNSNFTFEAGHIIPKFAERLSSPKGSHPMNYSRLNVLRDKQNRWRVPGDITNVRKYEPTYSDSYRLPMDTDYEKGDYVKLKNLIIGYRMPTALLKKANIGIERLKLSLQVDNVFTLTTRSAL